MRFAGLPLLAGIWEITLSQTKSSILPSAPYVNGSALILGETHELSIHFE